MPDARKVLAVPRAAYDEFVGEAGFKPWSRDVVDSLIHPLHMQFIDKTRAETDEKYLQIIPYVVFRWNNHFFTYCRGQAGEESRLHGNVSIGIGGHVEPEDGSATYPMTTIHRAVSREIREEIGENDFGLPKLIGTVFDDQTEVGRVHLGIVMEVELSRPDESKDFRLAPEIVSLGMCRLDSRPMDEFERWSAMVAAYYLSFAIQPAQLA
jgi:predicted NUDIX family phosphoesterase